MSELQAVEMLEALETISTILAFTGGMIFVGIMVISAKLSR